VVDIWRLIADRKIREAMDEGGFDNLKGAGEPLPVEDAPGADPALWMGHHIMKNSGVVPRWVAEGNEIEKERERLCALSYEERAAAALEFNRRIARFNLSAPAGAHKPPFSP
jgi:hypothetical protein